MLVSELKFNDESMGLIVRNLALECHDFALSRGIPSHSIEDQLPLVFGELDSHLGDLLHIRDVVTSDTSGIAGLAISFSDEGYLRIANAAKDQVAFAVDGNANTRCYVSNAPSPRGLSDD